MSVSRTICLGFLAVITVGTILLMMPFSTAVERGMTRLWRCLLLPQPSVSPVYRLWISAPISLFGVNF